MGRVDMAHGMGIVVLVDLALGKASGSERDGIGDWDGSGSQYLRGQTKSFDYGIELQFRLFVFKASGR
jgi:1,4-alpha-glucan branching enzyme